MQFRVSFDANIARKERIFVKLLREKYFFQIFAVPKRTFGFPEGRNSSAVEHFTRNEGVVSSNLIFGLFFRNPQDVRFCGFSGIMRNMTEIRTPFAGKRSAAKGVCCYKFQEDQFVQHILTELLAGHFKEHISCCHFPVLPPVRRVPGGKRRSRSSPGGRGRIHGKVRWNAGSRPVS